MKKQYKTLWLILLCAIAGFYFLYVSHLHKRRIPDISTMFVFPENSPVGENFSSHSEPTWRLYAKDEDIHFGKLVGDNNSSIKRPLPSPRSHVTLSSSHMIRLFQRDIGCARVGSKYGLIYQYLKIIISCFDKNQEIPLCYRWTWDPANWTLILSEKEEHFNIRGPYRICVFPRITNRVDKIVYPNGTEDLPGCTFKRSPCSIMEPYFDQVLNMRINWSPCCRRMMLDMLSATHDVFEYRNVRYVLVGGAVISVARENGKFIPYDTDLDIIVDKRDRAKFNNQTAADMSALGYYYQWRNQGSYIRICVNKVCDAHIDVWFYEHDPRDRHMIKYFKLWFWSIREEYMFPTSWILFEGKKYRFPRKILKYLAHEYSSGVMAGYHNWNQVLLCNFKRGRKCTFYS